MTVELIAPEKKSCKRTDTGTQTFEVPSRPKPKRKIVMFNARPSPKMAFDGPPLSLLMAANSSSERIVHRLLNMAASQQKEQSNGQPWEARIHNALLAKEQLTRKSSTSSSR